MPAGRDESCDGSPRPACHSTEALHSCGHLDVLQERACPSSSLPLPQAVSTVSSNLFPGLLSKPQVPPPSVPHRSVHVSRLGTQGCGSDPLCSCHSVLPATDGSLPSSRSPWSSRDPADLCACEGPFQDAGMSPLLQIPPGALSSSHFLSFLYLLSFILPCYTGIFLVLVGFRDPRPILTIISFVYVFLIHLGGKWLYVLLLPHHLDSPCLISRDILIQTLHCLILKDLRIYSGVLGRYLMERVFDSVQPHQDLNVCHGYLPKELGISQLTSCKVFIFSIHLSEAWCWYVGPKGCCQGSSSYEK